MLLKASKFFIYCAIASPLIVNRSFFFPFITPKALFFRITVELALLAFGAAALKGELSWQAIKTKINNPLSIAIAVFTALFFITCLTAINPSFALWSNFERGEGGWQILHYFLFFILLTLLYTTKKDWQWLIGWQVIVSALVGLYAVGQTYNWQWIINPSPGAISGTLGNPSYLGGYMLLNLFLALWLTLPSRQSVKEQKEQSIIRHHKPLMYGLRYRCNWFWLSLALFQLIIFIAAKTRGSFAALGAGIIFMIIFWVFNNKNNKRVWIVGITLILTILMGTTLLINTVKGDIRKSLEPRLWTWSTALAGIAEKPFLGWGAENFPFIFDQYYNPRHDNVEPWFDRAHNTLLEYATSGGIPLLIAYSALFYITLRELIKNPNKDHSWPFITAIPIMYIINGLVLFEILPLYLMLFLLMAFANAYAHGFSGHQEQMRMHEIKKRESYAPEMYTSIAIIPLTVIIALSLYYTAHLPFKKNKLLLAALQANNQSDEEVFKNHEKALASPSPIGQQEALQNFLVFTIDYFNYLKKNNLMEKVSKEKRQRIIDFAAQWYDKEKNNAIGVRILYLYAGMLLTEMETTNTQKYLTRVDALIAEGAEKAPTRLEFVRLDIASAALQKDKARYERAIKKGGRLRPDEVLDIRF